VLGHTGLETRAAIPMGGLGQARHGPRDSVISQVSEPLGVQVPRLRVQAGSSNSVPSPRPTLELRLIPVSAVNPRTTLSFCSPDVAHSSNLLRQVEPGLNTIQKHTQRIEESSGSTPSLAFQRSAAAASARSANKIRIEQRGSKDPVQVREPGFDGDFARLDAGNPPTTCYILRPA